VPETGIEPVRPLFTKRRILSPMCLPISPLGQHHNCEKKTSLTEPTRPLIQTLANILEARPRVELGYTDLQTEKAIINQ
jgi:hypothetical protein